MNLFQLASRGIDLDALPDESAPEREPLAFEPAPAGSRFAVPQEFDAAFQAAGDEYGVDPDVLRAMAFAESRFRPDVISGQVKSRTGAAGLMQFMPGTAERFGINPLDPVESIFGAAAYMRANLEKFDGDYGKAVAAYNWGESRKAYGSDDWKDRLPAETRGYLDTVFGAADELKLRAPAPMPPVELPPKNAAAPEAAKAQPGAIPERTWGEAFGDTTKSLAQGLLDVGSLPGVAYSAVTGDWDTGYLKAIRGTQEVLQDQKSAEIQARNKELQSKLSTAEGWREKLAVGGIETLKDPTLLFDTLARSAPGMFAGGVVGRGAGAAANAVGNAAFAKALGTGSELAARVAVTAKNGAGVLARATATGTAAGIQGASVASETYEELSKLPVEAFKSEPEWKDLEAQHGAQQAKEILAGAAANRALLMATGASVLSMKLVPGGDAIEKMFLPPSLKGAAAKAAVASTSLLTRPMGKGMEGGLVSKAVELIVKGSQAGALESVSEGVEEGTGAIAKGLELSRAGQRVNLSEMAGEAYGQGAAAGLVMGKVAGMQEAYGSRAPRVEDQPTTPQAHIVPSAPVAPQAPQSAQTDVAAQILQAEAAQPQATGLAAELDALRARSAPDFTQQSATPQAQPGSVPVTGGLAAELQALRARSSPQEVANAPQRAPSVTQQQTKATSAQAADIAGVNAPVPAANLSGAGVAATQAAGVDIPTTQGVPANVPQPAQPGTQASQTQSTQGAAQGPRVILQNRDRSTPSSIAQMRSIAARPDYGRLGFSRDFANGAPVVAGGEIQPAQLGRQDVATASDGRRIPVQYAVVDAGSVLTSNTVDGTSNPSYGDSNIPAVRAIAGNGRIAGLQSAYQSGNANAYRQELVQDASLHGIAPEVIAPMAQPVLVRVMPAEAVTADIGDISNTVGNLDLSAVEQANNDANRVQLEALQFADDGSITTDAVRQFVRAMPQSEQGQLLDTNGQPTRQAVDRLSAAVFAKAYGNEALTRLYSQAQDPEARLVMSALAQVAPKMARLEGAGALDVRDVVAQAAEIAVNARRQGIAIAKAAQQMDMAADPDVGVVLDLFASNSRTVRPVVEALGRMADLAYTEASKPAEDMFGAVPRATRADIITQLRPENERRSQEALEDAAGRESAAVDAVGQANEPAGSAASATTEAGRPSEDAAEQELNRPVALDQQAQAATKTVAPTNAQEGIAVAQAKAARFAIGKSLTKEQRKQVLESLVDTYKTKGAEREFKGLDSNGNDRYGYVYSPELFEKSDITGAMVRYYVTLPDGRIAHPTELFQDVSASDVERMALEQESKKKAQEAYENAIKPFYPDFDSANLMATTGQVVISKGDRLAIIPDRTGAVGQARQQGWEVAKQAQTAIENVVPESLELAAQTPAEAAARQDAQEQADKAEAAAKRAEDAAAKAEEERKRIAQASVRAADSFELGQDPMDSLTGQGGLRFSRAPAGGQTETAAFKRWFGDSKVVDADGNPLRVYHGTTKDFDAFDQDSVGDNFGRDNDGFFFTGSAVEASGYADPQSELLAAGRPDARRMTPLAQANVMPVYLSIKNPLTLERYTWAIASSPEVEIDESGVSLIDFFDSGNGDVTRYAKEKGHDGVLFQRGGKTLAVAFFPEQIKSATGNNGQFDPSNPDIRFSFAGQQAATADTMALATAQQRLEAGEDAETVRQETGWHKGVDGKWRFEISDAGAQLAQQVYFAERGKWYPSRFLADARDHGSDTGGTGTLGDVLEHPALFAAYPALRDMPVTAKIRKDQESGAFDGRSITATAENEGRLLSVLLHEIQHGIQNIEGFATGGSIESARAMQADAQSNAFNQAQGAWYESRKRWPSAYKSLMDQRMLDGRLYDKYDIKTMDEDGNQRKAIVLAFELRKKISEADKALRSQAQLAYNDAVESELGGFGSDAFNEFNGLYSAVTKAFEGTAETATSVYKRLAGEVEARNTQARQKLTADQRRATPPNQTADVADSEVIVVFNGKEMASAPTPANAAGAKTTTPIRDYGANYEALAGKDVTYTVPITEGGTASVTVDAQSVLTQYDQRMQALETLRKCL